MIKLLSIVPYKIFPAKVGGQKGIALFNEFLAKEVELLCLTVKSNDPTFARGYTIYNLMSDSFIRYINPFYIFKTARLIKKFQPSHLILEHPYYGWLGIILKIFTGIKLIIHSHNIESTRWKSLGKWWWKILWWYEKFTHQHADYNFFIQDEDRKYAIEHFKLKETSALTITYGIEWDKAPLESEKQQCRKFISTAHNIAAGEFIFLFNGALDYQPNLNAVNIILEHINPLLLAEDFKYKIIICGRGLPATYNNLSAYLNKNIIYAGFVDDISIYFKGADVFINPIVNGGGIKTKLVEALGYNTKTISTLNGSIGVNPADTNQQLTIIADGEWNIFKDKMMEIVMLPVTPISPSFYQVFYWGNIAARAVKFIQ